MKNQSPVVKDVHRHEPEIGIPHTHIVSLLFGDPIPTHFNIFCVFLLAHTVFSYTTLMFVYCKLRGFPYKLAGRTINRQGYTGYSSTVELVLVRRYASKYGCGSSRQSLTLGAY